MFLFLTGYLLLSRSYDSEKIEKFYKHNFVSLLVVWEVWILIYNLFLSWFLKEPFDLMLYLRRALFLEHAGLPHSWYIPMILGMYLFLPYVSNMLSCMSKKMLLVFILVLYGYLYLIPGLNLLDLAFHVSDGYRISCQLDLSYGGNVYGMYLLMGYSVARYEKNIKEILEQKSVRIVLHFTWVALYLATVFSQIWLYSREIAYNVWYDFLFLPVISIILFLVLLNRKYKGYVIPMVTQISGCSFGIYLIHELIILPGIKEMKKAGYLTDLFAIGTAAGTIVCTIIFFILAFSIVKILSKNSYMAHLFLKK